jgi:acetyl-CoA C-acetyltransferase
MVPPLCCGPFAAGNASPISDGAAAVVLASAAAVRQYRLPVLGRVLGFGDAATDPRDFPVAPTLAVPKALAHAGLGAGEVEYWEVNEAFSVVDLANRQLLGLDPERWVGWAGLAGLASAAQRCSRRLGRR